MDILLSVTLFAGVGAAFVLVNLAMGALARPNVPNPEKAAAYECGEPAIGASWVQFDLRFYIVALVYLIFDVEVALFYPWAVAYGSAGHLGEAMGLSAFDVRQVALVDMLFFFGILLVGFAYLWRFGYLDWVRSAATTSLKVEHVPGIDLRPAPLPVRPDLDTSRHVDRLSRPLPDGAHPVSERDKSTVQRVSEGSRRNFPR